MENSSGSADQLLGLDYWLRWQVFVSSLVFIIPGIVAVNLIRRNSGNDELKSKDLWVPCWRNMHPVWLLVYRAVACVAMAWLLYETVKTFGFFVFFFYTQWTFVLVVIYFALGTIVSARGCMSLSRKTHVQNTEKEKFLGKDSKVSTTTALKEAGNNQQAGFLEKLLHMIYQTCAGAVMLTDIVFWGLLLPFMAGQNFQLTLLIGCMHSVNAIFLLLDTAINSMPFSWFGIVYFVLWGVIYIIFQWTVHACCVSWWPYPFLELSTPFAPLWYLGLGLVHVPCYAIYPLVMKAKNGILSRLFPHSFVRMTVETKKA